MRLVVKRQLNLVAYKTIQAYFFLMRQYVARRGTWRLSLHVFFIYMYLTRLYQIGIIGIHDIYMTSRVNIKKITRKNHTSFYFQLKNLCQNTIKIRLFSSSKFHGKT